MRMPGERGSFIILLVWDSVPVLSMWSCDEILAFMTL